MQKMYFLITEMGMNAVLLSQKQHISHVAQVSLFNKVSVISIFMLSHIFITLYCGYILSLGVTKG